MNESMKTWGYPAIIGLLAFASSYGALRADMGAQITHHEWRLKPARHEDNSRN
jgi:hypothetical protein